MDDPSVGLPIEAANHVTQFYYYQTLGRGSFGKVHLVRFHGNGQVYALKELDKTHLVNRNQVEHTFNERDILLSINHPLIVRCFATFQNRFSVFLVLEFVIGGDLYSYLRAFRRFREEHTRFYAAEVLIALEYLHSRDIIYRDLKPENLLLTREGHIKLADFGYAKRLAGSPDGRTYSRCGTPEYMAPEILFADGHDFRVDWWAYGNLVYEMLAGFAPFGGEDELAVYERIRSGLVGWPSRFRLISKDFLRRLLTVEPNRRLGANGSHEIRSHQYFGGFDWAGAENLTLDPPIKPPLDGSDVDGNNFETLPLEIPRDDDSLEDAHMDPFEGF